MPSRSVGEIWPAYRGEPGGWPIARGDEPFDTLKRSAFAMPSRSVGEIWPAYRGEPGGWPIARGDEP
ncbi:hypothetical protein CQA67_33325, partial [Klebsiella pneumoniae]